MILHNCAFCGGEPRLTKCGNQKEYLVYQCSECYMSPVKLDEASLCTCNAKRRWNKRTEEAKQIINIYNMLQASMTKFTCSEGK